MLDSSSVTIILIKRQEMDSLENGFSTNGVTHQSVNEQIKLATEPIPRQIEKPCALLASRNGLETPGKSEAIGSRLDDMSASSADNRFDTELISQGDSFLEVQNCKNKDLVFLPLVFCSKPN